LRIVPSPAAARELMFKYISPSTTLIGHAIENDLNVLRIIHPRVIDTGILFPGNGGYPIRRKLQALALEYLNREIQTDSVAGHNSVEDSAATGDLVRFRIKQEVEKLLRESWTITDTAFIPPAQFQVEGNLVNKFCVRLPHWWKEGEWWSRSE